MFKNDTLVFLDNLKRFGWKLGLKNISDVLSAIGNPHHRFQCIHIGGTNGKGSTAAFLDSILRQSGYKIGLFTSPHLLEINERIQVGGQRISDGEFSRRVSDMKSILTEKGCTYFEAVTAVAFQYFADAGIDIAIIEVGLGGRFDATNVVHSLVSMITNVDLDHTEWLGQSRTAIAKEKAGIIKPDGCCLSGSEDKNVNLVLKQAAHEKNARFFELDRFFTYHVNHMSAQGAEFNLEIAETLYKDIRINLVGEHQIRNAALAVMTCHILREQNIPVGKQDICRGLRNANWPARLQLLLARPQIVVDVAHNPASIRCLLETVQAVFKYERLIVVIGFLEDKKFATMSKDITDAADLVFIVPLNTERALPVLKLKEIIQKYTDRYRVCSRFEDVFKRLRVTMKKEDLILVTGSHTTVGQFLQLNPGKKFFNKNA